jgi:long-subunit fatty acid transport protein
MRQARTLKAIWIGIGMSAIGVWAQKPGDTLYSLDMGGRGYGMGGAFAAIADDVTAAAWNPAGLAYLSKPEFSIVMRTLPTYQTTLAGNVINPASRTTGSSGDQRLGFAGLALPLGKNGKGPGGTLGIAYWRGGFYENNKFAARLTSGDPDSNLEIRPYIDNTEISVDFFTLAYARKLTNNMQFGIGLLYVQENFNYFHSETLVDPNDPNNDLGTTESTINETGTGFGVQVGVMSPFNTMKGTWGVTYRSEMKLRDFGGAAAFGDTVPAKVSFGASYLLLENPRGSNTDFLVGAAQIDHFFKSNSGLADQRDNATNFGLGLQYTLGLHGFLVPVRVGFHSYQAGNDQTFSDENIFTFGLGYRPLDGRWGLNLDFGSSNRHSGMDTSLSLNYQFGED